jgi:hypothetical protein
MRLRKLRIAWSLFCGLACVLLFALWYRSYWTEDVITRVSNRPSAISVGSQVGTFSFAYFDASAAYKSNRNPYASHIGWEYTAIEANLPKQISFWERGPTSATVNVRHWQLAILVSLIGAVIWLPWQFSLRTLLIATTLVAGVLGLAVWAASK